MMRLSTLAAVAVLSTGLGGCPGDKAVLDAPALAQPAPELMADPAPLVAIPDCEAAKDCRVRYYARSRQQYGDLADRMRGLQRYVSTVTAK